MKDKFPEIFKNRVDKIKGNVQKEFYYHNGDNNDFTKNDERKKIDEKEVDKVSLLKKINGIFTRPDYIYQADITILYKNGKNINKKIVGIKDNYLLTFEGERIYIDEIYDIK